MTATRPLPRLYDMHCHLGLFENPAAVAHDLASLGVGALSCGVEPAGFAAEREALTDVPGVTCAAGLHPWWLDDGRCGMADAEALASLVPGTRHVGEVGLDLAPRHAASAETQLAAFRLVAAACAATGGRVLSIHSVRAADEVLDVLEETGCLSSCICVFHWFSGSTPQLWRAIRAGAWFSFGERSLATRKGREYVRLVPRERLLLETDYPPTPADGIGAKDVKDSLERALAGLEAARGERLTETLAASSRRLLLA